MMSSCSSEVDVVRTRITTCDDDNGILYAYQSKPGYANVNQNVQADTSNEEHQKTIVDILSHCQVIQDAIQKLDKKFNIIHKKVSKIYRFRTKLIWQNRKPLGYAYKHYTYLLSRKVKLQKSPKFPPVYTQADPPYYASNEPAQRSPCMSSFGNQGPHSCTSVPGKSSLAYNPEMMGYPALLERDCRGHDTSSSCNQAISRGLVWGDINSDKIMIRSSMICFPSSLIEAAGSSVGTDQSVIQEDLPDDPSIWTVEQVVLFLQHLDPELFAPLANTFRQHDIDGSALLLLPNDIMIKYMGIKLGTALKLSHYIVKLKEQKGIDY
uniref:SAM domain-containing protein n=1 Tax=Myotis lucifugus TaxID=59463 RepID=G1Q8H8_MYOLU